MRLELKTGTIVPAVTLAEIKDYGYHKSDSNDTLINALIEPVTDYIEHITGRRMINQSWYIYLDYDEYYNRLLGFKNSIVLSTLNVSSIVEVVTFDRSNTSTIMDSSEYRLSGNQFSHSSNMVLNDNLFQTQSLPNLRRVDSVRIEVVAGYGAAAAEIPKTVLTSLKVLANHWVQFGQRVTKDGLIDVPINLDAMLLPYKSTESWM